jgi:hypothetical protein
VHHIKIKVIYSESYKDLDMSEKIPRMFQERNTKIFSELCQSMAVRTGLRAGYKRAWKSKRESGGEFFIVSHDIKHAVTQSTRKNRKSDYSYATQIELLWV